MTIYDSLIAKAIGGSGGGGGSSDFSTATMIVTNNTESDVSAIVPVVIDNEELTSSTGEGWFEIGTSTHGVILFKGKALIYIPNGGITIATTGNIEDDGYGYYYVTGNCTITIS